MSESENTSKDRSPLDKSSGGKKPYRDDLPMVKASRLQALRLITPKSRDVEITVGGLTRRVGVTFLRFDWMKGPAGWACFLCPSCGRRCAVLRLYDGRLACRSCDGLKYATGALPAAERVRRLEASLYGDAGPVKRRPLKWPRLNSQHRLEARLRRAKIAMRRKALRGFDPDQN